jgi:hypothetical protein
MNPSSPPAPEIAQPSPQPTSVEQTPSSQPLSVAANSPSPAQAAPTATPLSDRERIYQQYYGNPQDPAPVPSLEPAAQAGLPEPVADGLPIPPAPAAPDYNALIQSLQQQVEELKRVQSPAPQQQAPPPVVPAADLPADFLAAIASGDPAKAKEALIRELAPQITQAAVLQAMETQRVNSAVTEFVTDLRSKNADIVPFEKYVTIEAQEELQALQAAGKITNNDQYIEAYKQSVNKAVLSIRKQLQLTRAAGKEEGLTTQRTVLAAQPLPPNAIDPNRGSSPQAAPPLTSEEANRSYLEQRMKRSLSNRGL